MRIIKNNENNYSNVSPSVSSCYHDHLHSHQVVINDAAKRMIKWALNVCTKRFPNLADTQHKVHRCSVHMNKKQTTPNLEVCDNSKYVMAIKVEWKCWKSSGKFRGLVNPLIAWHYSSSEFEDSFYGSSLQETNQIIDSMNIISRFSWVASNCRRS